MTAKLGQMSDLAVRAEKHFRPTSIVVVGVATGLGCRDRKDQIDQVKETPKTLAIVGFRCAR